MQARPGWPVLACLGCAQAQEAANGQLQQKRVWTKARTAAKTSQLVLGWTRHDRTDQSQSSGFSVRALEVLS